MNNSPKVRDLSRCFDSGHRTQLFQAIEHLQGQAKEQFVRSRCTLDKQGGEARDWLWHAWDMHAMYVLDALAKAYYSTESDRMAYPPLEND